MFCFHKWGKWSAPFDTAHSHIKLQSCQCEKCGKVKVAKIKQPWNQWFSAVLLKGEMNDTRMD